MVKKRQFMLPPMLPLLDDCTPKSRLHPQLENGANGQNRLVQARFSPKSYTDAETNSTNSVTTSANNC